MAKKRRSDKNHDIGDSKPGTVGDKRPTRDKGDTPMERIHNRRDGDQMSWQEVSAFIAESEEQDEDAAERSENEQAKVEGYEDKWHKKFEHLPGVPDPE